MQADTTGNDINAIRQNRILWKRFKRQSLPQTFVLLGILFLIIFSYIPMFGILMAFKDYRITDGVQGIFTSEWVGLKYLNEFVGDYRFNDLV
ncbi:sugar ABC transporter permease, partial [Paenibacillus sp. MCAF20]